MSTSIFGDDWFAESHPGFKAKRGRKSKKVSNATVSKVVKNYVQKKIDNEQEFKAIMTNQNSLNLYNGGTGQMILLNGCVNTSPMGLSTRVGREIQNRSVQITISYRVDATSTNDFGIRAIVFIDLDPNGVAPTAVQLLDTASGAGLDEAYRNLVYRNRFVILKDKYLHGPAYNNNGALVTNYSRLIKYKKLKLNTVFNSGNAGTIADIQKGALYCFLISMDGSGYPPLGFINAVVRFTDA